MNKAELCTLVAKQNKITKQDAIKVVKSVFDIIIDALDNNEKVIITGFGSLNAVNAKARIGRNPQTGSVVNVPAKRKIKWSASTTLKRKINTKANK